MAPLRPGRMAGVFSPGTPLERPLCFGAQCGVNLIHKAGLGVRPQEPPHPARQAPGHPSSALCSLGGGGSRLYQAWVCTSPPTCPGERAHLPCDIHQGGCRGGCRGAVGGGDGSPREPLTRACFHGPRVSRLLDPAVPAAGIMHLWAVASWSLRLPGPLFSKKEKS